MVTDQSRLQFTVVGNQPLVHKCLDLVDKQKHGYLGASKKKNGCIGDPSCHNIKLWYCVFCVFQVQHISTAALVWLWSRTDLQKSFLPIVMVFMAVTCYRPLVIEYVQTFFEHYNVYILFSSSLWDTLFTIIHLMFS